MSDIDRYYVEIDLAATEVLPVWMLEDSSLFAHITAEGIRV